VNNRPVRSGRCRQAKVSSGTDETVEDDDASKRWLSRRLLLILGSAALLSHSWSRPPISHHSPFYLLGLILLALFLVFRTIVDRYILSRFGAIFVGSAATLFTLFAVYELVSLLDDSLSTISPSSLPSHT